ncbi:hypothetical protein [Bradyrhizobium liaoningense]|uniref:hypothetical protein n=1 Tax=Bradyrhizobium liaoningense TaxID=43992 RepID=UPI001BA47B95|nr:hypothetical protein [Bradyrhizobium liaoningense]MBR0858106.1 hypothetical protein [Bradyrhizobium liaoningense]
MLGRREGAVTVPVLDGPFLPNQKLEIAPVLCEIDQVDNLVALGAKLFASSGSALFRLEPAFSSGPETVASFETPITAMAGMGEALAVGLDRKGIIVRGGRFDGMVVQPPATSCGVRLRSRGWTSRHLRCATGRNMSAQATGVAR